MGKVLPPVIRVFISSTFVDMNRERDYFNTVIAPQLTRLCAERGVSFFSVDLRWGITEEDQIDGNVIPICFREIDHCRPFFIGILGNRYGSIINNITMTTKETFPWINDQMGKSMTELEMYYGVLRHESDHETMNCAFFFRSSELSSEFFPKVESEEKAKKLALLKETIQQEGDIPSFVYHSLEQFEHEVISVVSAWLDKEFPSMERVHDTRKKWYNSELLRDYMNPENVYDFLESYCRNATHSLMISGKGLRGKTTVLTEWTPRNGEKILINCGADDAYQYWPTIAHEIVNKLLEIDESIGFPNVQAYASLFFRMMDGIHSRNDEDEKPEHTMYYVTDGEMESLRLGFVSWLKTIKPCVTVYIVINDLNLLGDASTEYLNWLPVEIGENMHLICSANDDTIIDNALSLGWNVKEMPLFSRQNIRKFLDQYMSIFGKNMSAVQKANLLSTPLLQYPGYLKYIIRYFNNFGNFENLNHLTNAVGRMTSEKELYRFVLDNLINLLSPQEMQAVQVALSILSVTSLGLREDDLYVMVQELSPIDIIGWARIHVIFEQFQLITVDTWKIWDKNLREIVWQFEVNQKSIHCTLGKFFFNHMDKSIAHSSKAIKCNTDYAKSTLYHYGEAEDWETLLELLKDWRILYYLSKMEWNTVRSSWMQLLIFSNVDVSKELMHTFEMCVDEHTNIEGIKHKLISLMADLELWQISHTASIQSGIPEISKLRSMDSKSFSEEALQTYNKFCAMKKRRQFPKLLTEVTAYLQENEEKLNPAEKCCFIMLKLDCELQLGNIDHGLATSNQYHSAAIASMNYYELLRATLSRCQLLYFSERYEEAQKAIEYCKKLAFNLGAVREYLSSINIAGMCAYRQKRFSKSLTAFETCIRAWRRLGDSREITNCWLNKCNALYLSGNLQEAIDESENLCGFVDSLKKDEYTILFVKVLNNLGFYYNAQGKTDKAEAIYLKALGISKSKNIMAANDYCRLISFYQEHQQFTKAINVYQEYINYLHQKGEYRELAHAVKECLDLLLLCNYSYKAKTFKNKWKTQFDNISGGYEMFKAVFGGTMDPFLENRLKEDLVVARSERNNEKCGEILQRMASLIKNRDGENACDLYIQAMDYFMLSENQVKNSECACQAVRLLINLGIKDSRFDRVYSTFSSSDRAIIDEWLSLRDTSISNMAYVRGINRILEQSQIGNSITAYCLFDEANHLIKRLPKETLLKVVGWMKEDQLYQAFSDAIHGAITPNFISEIDYLRRNCTGNRADKLLAFFEKTIVILEALDSKDAGAIAGNIALIYRRRMDKEQTICHHKMAIRIYQAHNQTRDMYIEKMNLATAYKEFGELDRSIELLRKTIKESDLSYYSDLQASIAGNLAAVLIELRDSTYDDEIVACFGIEEAYFEKSGEMRELVISLINQVQYYLEKRMQHIGVIREKYRKAEQIVREHSLNEFSQYLHKLGPWIM